MFDAVDAPIRMTAGVDHRTADEVFIEVLAFGQWNPFPRSVEDGAQKALRRIGVVDAVERNE